MQTAEATIIATFSRRMRIRMADNTTAEARIKGKRLKPVCGDRVIVTAIDNESDLLITEIEPRRNELSRPNMRGRIEVLAANVDLLIVVAAAAPAADWFIIDRYLCAAENMQADALLVFNKIDVAEPDQEFADYGPIGYDTIVSSAAAGTGIDEIGDYVGERVAIMVGQSGVGKSSIINSLTGSAQLRTAAISDKTREGRHTTVNSEMLNIPSGGHIIDSPGVRDFAPALSNPEQVARGYREIVATAQDCRFANCRHLREPNCAVKTAVERGEINARRYESYRRLLGLTQRLENPRQ